MLGERLYQLVDELKGFMGITELADVLQFDKSTPANWRKRAAEGKAPDHLSYLKVAEFFQWSEDWLDGRPGAERWSPALIGARDELMDFARNSGLNDRSDRAKAKRLTATWEHLYILIPQFDLQAWLIYLRWRQSDWDACITEGFPPSAIQIAGASQVTGIPERWFWDGDTACLAPISDRDKQRLERFMAEQNIGADDLMRMWQQMKNPR